MMDNLHSVLRNIHSETKSRRDHLAVFREFLSHLDRLGRRPQRSVTKSNSPRPMKRRAK
jgi:hypothetical protein